jgi:hypothetical protein
MSKFRLGQPKADVFDRITQEQIDALAPFLRSRAERAREITGVKLVPIEIAASLMVTHGNISAAARLLTRATGLSIGQSYLRRKIRDDEKLTEWCLEQYNKGKPDRLRRGFCRSCGAILQPPPK